MKRSDSTNPTNIIYIGDNTSQKLGIERFCGVPDHQHPFWELVVYYQGSGTGYVGDIVYKFEPGTAVAIPPNRMHRETSDDNYCDYHIYFPALYSGLDVIVAHDNSGRLIQLAETLYTVFSEKKHNYISLSNSIAFSVFEYIKSLCAETSMSEHTRYFTQLIREHLWEQSFDIASQAQQYGITMHHLRYCFDRDIGKTPLEYLTELRMERARQLIISSSMRIKDIAEWCGYTDSYYFSRCFKKYYGVSPEMFRSSLTTNCSGPIPERRTLLDE